VRRLSGWQRLWVVFAILYLLPVAVFTVSFVPKKTDTKRQWAFATIEIVKKYDEKLKNEDTWDIWRAYSDMSYEELIKRIRDKYSRDKYSDKSDRKKGPENKWEQYRVKGTPRIPDIEFDTVNKEYQQKLNSLWKEQAKVVSIGGLSWGFSVIAVYILGMAVGWVYRGFKADVSKGK
jgi:hypothetical protein